MARKWEVYSGCCWSAGGTWTLIIGVEWLRVSAWGGEPVLHHSRTSLTFEVTMSLALDEE